MLKYDARKAPDTPPSAAPTPYACSFVRTIGTPALAAAPTSPEMSVLAVMQRALAMAWEPGSRKALQAVTTRTEVRILPMPAAAAGRSMFDCKSTRHLIEDAYELTVSWLAAAHDLKVCEQNGRVKHALVAA